MRARTSGSRWIALVTAATLATIVAPLASAPAATEPPASSSAAPRPAKALKRLSTQLKVLRQRIQKLEAGVRAAEAERGAPRVPFGPAGGALAGAYPNPGIAPAAIGPANLQAGAVGAAALQPGAVGAGALAPGAVTEAAIAPRVVQRNNIGEGAVGAAELANLVPVISEGVLVGVGEVRVARATCPAGTKLISGGHRWVRQELSFIVRSAPADFAPGSTWEVRGSLGAGSVPSTLFAHALCLRG